MQTLEKIPNRYIFLFLIFFIYNLLFACSVNKIDSQKDENMMTVTGIIRLVGNEPFTHLVLTTDEGKDYLIRGDFEKELRHLQYQKVMAKGKEMQPAEGFKYSIDVKEYKIIETQIR
jgi:hypothetical protein